MKFSVLMSTYIKENPEYLRLALESLKKQNLQADEIVIVKDGPLTPELDGVIDEFLSKLPIKSVALEKNGGLGNALRIGVEACNYDVIARMDTDDICRSDRFEKQIKFLQENPDIDIVGSWISEFENNPEDIYAHRILPTSHDDMIQFAKRRNPLNHMTVVYKKSAVLKAGSYMDHNLFEDYYLWIRMIVNGSRLANLPEYLVNVRAGRDMLARRSGIKYAKSELSLQRKFRQLGFLNCKDFIYNVILRVPVRVMPTRIIKLVYGFLRGSK